MSPTLDIIWLHNELRVADNPLLHFEKLPEQLLCVYVLDQRWLQAPFPGETPARIGPARLRFLWQSLIELRGELLRRGSDLLVRIGSPVEEVAVLAQQLNAQYVRVAEQSGADETADIKALKAELPDNIELDVVESGVLIDRERLPFSLEELPSSFSAFRRHVEAHCTLNAPLPAPVTLPPWPEASRGFPALQKVCGVTAAWQPDERQGLAYAGGEAAGLERLEDYVCKQDGPASYKQTRNGLLGSNFSTRLSPWLAHGCISPSQVHQKVKAWEAKHGSSESSYWITFELLWRDYFHRAAQREGAAMFGSHELPKPCAYFTAWREGNTGLPFVDAAMLELRLTGWISNRARQNVASFLVKDLGVDWRLGAAWFEHCLIDYDVASNWGNWRYMAGVGRDPRQDRYFNVLKQAGHYDPKGCYVANWLPALGELPCDLARQQPWRVLPESFAPPVVEPDAWQRWLIDNARATHP
ncbi:DASH family cryptochrome [Halomonas llamarensis]|uniref:Cryptochrome DASH n=1 Tax=Halomonas llamarensis TaxID=2945104 RepID=A0ABT0SQC4_9GAMM|nr:DASH family cryptochrome [Halomonas llamarensis]MCL7929554.1 DASH family cryptochrome [Halomonas llamarensis]